MLTFGSVCSGIEAASVAWKPLGWRASFLSEIEAFPRAVLGHHYPETPLHGDFTTIRAGQYEPIDLLVGGTPCQSFSVAGLRGGLADDRGNLALEYLRLADRLRPRWLVWENVPGVLSSAGGRDFGSILGGLVELGYGFAYRVLDAQFFGVAQRRRRVFVVGYAGDWRRAAAVLFERHSLQGHPAPSREAGAATTVCPTLRSGGNRTGGDRPPGTDVDTADSLIVAALTASGVGTCGADDNQARTGHLLPAYCLDVAYALSGGPSGNQFGTGRGAQDTFIASIAFMSNASGANFTAGHDQSPTLRIGGGGGNAMAVAVFDPNQITSAANGSVPTPELAHTLPGTPNAPVAFTVSGPAHGFAWEKPYASAVMETRPSDGANTQTGVRIGSAVRRLTPRECERLQGFPDDYTAIPYRGKPAADGPRYKALGNSMAVPVMAWIGRRIAEVDTLQLQAEAA